MRTICTRSCFSKPNVNTGLQRSTIASSWRPTSRCCCAFAAGTARPAATTSAAAKAPIRLCNERLPFEGAEHPAQALLELDRRLPAEQLAGARDVRLPHLRVVDGEGLVDDLALRAGDAEDGLRELVEGELARVPEVHRQVLPGFGEQEKPANQGVDV